MSITLDFTEGSYSPSNPVTLSFGDQPLILDSISYSISYTSAIFTSEKYLFSEASAYSLTTDTLEIFRDLLIEGASTIYTLSPPSVDIAKALQLSPTIAFITTGKPLLFITQKRISLDLGSIAVTYVPATDMRPQHRILDFHFTLEYLVTMVEEFDARPTNRVAFFQSTEDFIVTFRDNSIRLPVRVLANKLVLGLILRPAGIFRTIVKELLDTFYILSLPGSTSFFLKKRLYCITDNLHYQLKPAELIKRVLLCESTSYISKVKSKVPRRQLRSFIYSTDSDFNISWIDVETKVGIVLETSILLSSYGDSLFHLIKPLNQEIFSVSGDSIEIRYFKVECNISVFDMTVGETLIFQYSLVNTGNLFSLTQEALATSYTKDIEGTLFQTECQIAQFSISLILEENTFNLNTQELKLNQNLSITSGSFLYEGESITSDFNYLLEFITFSISSLDALLTKNYFSEVEECITYLSGFEASFGYIKVLEKATDILDSIDILLRYNIIVSNSQIVLSVSESSMDRLLICGSLNLAYIATQLNPIIARDTPVTQVRFLAIT